MNKNFETIFYLILEELTEEALKSNEYKKAADKTLELEKSIRAISNNNINKLFNEYQKQNDIMLNAQLQSAFKYAFSLCAEILK